MTQQAISTIVITRLRSALNALRAYSVVIDGRKVDKLDAGVTKRFGLSPGTHEISVAMDFYKSPPLVLNLSGGETVTLECGEKASLGGHGQFSLRGLGSLLGSALSPSEYFFVRIVSTDTAGDSRPGDAIVKQTVQSSSPRGEASAPTIFLSYRRDDTEHITGRIRDRLDIQFGEQAIFRDVDSIPAGIDFTRKVEESIREARVLVAIIGPQWVAAVDRQGRRRLEQPDDPVRFELETAIGLGLPILPVLVKQAVMPGRDDLPAPLAALSSINAVIIPPEPYFAEGVKRLGLAIESLKPPVTPADLAQPRSCSACDHRINPGQAFCTRCGQRI